MKWRSALLPALATLALAACQTDGVGPETGEVEVAFRTVTSLQLGGGPAASSTVSGDNGTLRIDEVLMVVGKFKLEGAPDACLEADDEDELDDCESFEAEPFLLDLALDGSAVTVVHEQVASGSFSELEFEVEDIEMDDDDDDPDELSDLEAILRSRVSDWPDGASMFVQGVFTPTGGDPRPFRVFVDAEVEVEMAFDEPIVVGEDNRVEITIVLDPARWFREGDGQVLDLSAFDFDDDEELLELEVKLKDGFTEVEVELDD